MSRRGEVVLVDYPYSDDGSKIRPALVVQNDRDNARLAKTIIVMITGNLRRAGDPSHLLVDPATPDGAGSGLNGRSLVSCNNVFTIDQTDIIRTLGRLPAVTMQRVNGCLKAALGIP